MKKGHRLILAGTAMLPILGAGGLVAHAATDTGKPQDTLIQKLVSKFNLNETEVKSVFEEVRTEKQAEMKANYEESLAEAVTNGELSQAQSDLIAAKRTELQEQRDANRSSWSDLTDDERHAKMEEQRDALKAWADQNGIELKWLMGHGGRGGHGPGKFGH